MQCTAEMAYRNDAHGRSRLFSSLLSARMSTMRNVPPGRSERWMFPSTVAGCAWSWMASNAVTRSNSASAPSAAASRVSKVALARPQAAASARAATSASSLKSKPTKLLAGYARASRLMAWPSPQPTSATRIPASSRSVRPVAGMIVSISDASLTAPLSAARMAWKPG